LIEEAARIYGYEKIPEDRVIPVLAGTPGPAERVTERVRSVLAGAGFDEALTLTFTPVSLQGVFDPVPDVEATAVEPAAGEYGNRLRKSLIPSLVAVRRENERKGNLDARLYEIARVFRAPHPDDPRSQPLTLGLVSGGSFSQMRGVLDALLQACGVAETVRMEAADATGLQGGRGAKIWLGSDLWGWMGELDRQSAGSAALKLREPATIAEVGIEPLIARAQLIPHARPLAAFPGVERDLNFVLDEAAAWDRVEQVVRQAAPDCLDSVEFVDQYRGKQLPSGKKSYVLKVTYQAGDRTLTGEEVDAMQQRVIAACARELGAVLRG
jgi:phenylalanyl-tRNA synthetase beta chain